MLQPPMPPIDGMSPQPGVGQELLSALQDPNFGKPIEQPMPLQTDPQMQQQNQYAQPLPDADMGASMQELAPHPAIVSAMESEAMLAMPQEGQPGQQNFGVEQLMQNMPTPIIPQQQNLPNPLQVPQTQAIKITQEQITAFASNPDGLNAIVNKQVQANTTQVFQQTLNNALPHLYQQVDNNINRRFATDDFYKKHPQYKSMPHAVTNAIRMAKEAMPFGTDESRLDWAANMLQVRERQLAGFNQASAPVVHNAMNNDFRFGQQSTGGRATANQAIQEVGQPLTTDQLMMQGMQRNVQVNNPQQPIKPNPRRILGRRVE